MIPRTLEPELMDHDDEAVAYDTMDHRAVNLRFVQDVLAAVPSPRRVLDLGAGTALIPIVFAARAPHVTVNGVDLAGSMLRQGARNVARAGLMDRVALTLVDTKSLPYAPGDYDLVVSNSLVHHIPSPGDFFASVAALARDGAARVFVRDLARPASAGAVDDLVARYAANDSPTQRALFHASLHAALTLDEVAAFAHHAGLTVTSLSMTSDRHWTLVG